MLEPLAHQFIQALHVFAIAVHGQPRGVATVVAALVTLIIVLLALHRRAA